MTNTTTRISVFVSSPTDLAPERSIVEEICLEINKIRGRNDGFVLDPILYENEAHSGKSNDGQMAINEQLADQMNIYLGIMGAKFGSKTPRSGSGTEEEFNIALTQYQQGQCHEISFYFKELRLCDNIKSIELAKVEKFKERVRSEGILTKDFGAEDDFKSKINADINRMLPNVMQRITKPKAELKASSETGNVAISALQNLSDVDDEDSDGLEELLDMSAQGFQSVENEAGIMSSHIIALGNDISAATGRIKSASTLALSNPSAAQTSQFKEANTVAKAMERYVQGIAQTLPPLHKAMDEALSATRQAVTLVLSDFGDVDDSDMAQFSEGMAELYQTLSTVYDQIEDFSAPIVGLPRLTSEFNRAKKRTIAVNKDILAFFERSMEQLQDLLDLSEKP